MPIQKLLSTASYHGYPVSGDSCALAPQETGGAVE